jgi:hypothetical protein
LEPAEGEYNRLGRCLFEEMFEIFHAFHRI